MNLEMLSLAEKEFTRLIDRKKVIGIFRQSYLEELAIGEKIYKQKSSIFHVSNLSLQSNVLRRKNYYYVITQDAIQR